MIEVTAAIDGEGPNRRAQICAALSMGSNGNSSGLLTVPTVFGLSARVLAKQLVRGLASQRVQAARGQPAAQRGEGQRGDLLARPGLPPSFQVPAGAEPRPVLIKAADQLV